MNKNIIYFGEKTINIRFFELKKLILGTEKRLVLYFSYKSMKIDESYLVRDYPEFLYEKFLIFLMNFQKVNLVVKIVGNI